MTSYYCPICKTQSKFLILKDGFSHFRCTNDRCALIFVYPPPSNLEDVYGHSLEPGPENNSTKIQPPKLKKTLSISIARTFISKMYSPKVLDIGCGTGNFILSVQDICEEIIGIEPNKLNADYCNLLGLSIRNEFFSANSVQKNSIDLINMGDVIEHVEDPRSFLKAAIIILKAGGILIIRTPNLDSLWSKLTFRFAKTFDVPWSSLTPPKHISNFSLTGLINLINEEGLLIESIMHEGPSLFYELGQLHLRRDFIRKPTITNLLKLLFGYGTYSTIYLLNQILKPFLSCGFSQILVAKKLKQDSETRIISF